MLLLLVSPASAIAYILAEQASIIDPDERFYVVLLIYFMKLFEYLVTMFNEKRNFD